MQRARTLDKTVWPSGLRRWLQAPVRKGVGSNPTAVTFGNFVAIPCRNHKRLNAHPQASDAAWAESDRSPAPSAAIPDFFVSCGTPGKAAQTRGNHKCLRVCTRIHFTIDTHA